MAKKKDADEEIRALFGDFYGGVEEFKDLVVESKPEGRVNESEIKLNREDEAGVKGALAKVFDEFSVVAGHMPMSAKQEQFLRAYVKCKNLTKSLVLAGANKGEYRDWLKKDTPFASAVGYVTDFVADQLEDAGLELALAGNEKLLIKFLEAYRPEKFSPKRAIDIKSEHNINVTSWQELALSAEKANRATKTVIQGDGSVIEAEILEEDDEDDNTGSKI